MSAVSSTEHDRIDLVAMSGKPVLRRRRPGQLAVVVLLVLVVLWAAGTLVTNDGFDWPVVGRYLLDTRILAGLLVTIQLTVIAEVIGIVGGLVLAVMRMSDSRVIAGVAGAYIWFFRGTPLLVQLLFWGFAAAIFPEVGIGVPFGGPMFVSWDTNQVISLMTAAILGLGLNEAAYTAEVVRAGLLSVPKGQTEASRAMGFSSLQTLRHVVVPQAMKVIIPPIGNNVNAMLKTTSLVVVIGVGDILYNAQQIYAKNLEQIPLLIVASIWYLVLTTLVGLGQSRLERRFSRDAVPLTLREAR
ncbi:amino acid ABC transporter permease [Nocardioides kongjuensis]|uniref:Polar amino acid transport system permease protein n=1 Tax=Nocardioides kongjuensis TaxID=349522 RepID=A0A852RZK0_9ACTN|nr:amino acid ABC transporter permease [Nocardioides kongjuensis]NYD33254.1 polar amino acid transport system permease protein [Nocardioides kongjuensis]